MRTPKKTGFDKIDSWLESRKPYQLTWLVFILLFHGNLTVPLSMWSMYEAGVTDFQFLTLTILSFTILVVCLSGQQPTITIPVWFISTVIIVCMDLLNLIEIFWV